MKITVAFPRDLAEVQKLWSEERSWPKRLGLLHFFTKNSTIPDDEHGELQKWMLACCKEIASVLLALQDENHEERCDRCSDFHYPTKDGSDGYGFILSAATVNETLVAGLRTTLCYLVSLRQQQIAGLTQRNEREQERWLVYEQTPRTFAAADEVLQSALEFSRWINLHQEPMRKLLQKLLRDYQFRYSSYHGWRFHPSLPGPEQLPLPEIWYDVAILSASGIHSSDNPQGVLSPEDSQVESAVRRFVQKQMAPKKDGTPIKFSDLSKRFAEATKMATELLLRHLVWSGRLDEAINFGVGEEVKAI
jgi:hypothetical protein